MMKAAVLLLSFFGGLRLRRIIGGEGVKRVMAHGEPLPAAELPCGGIMWVRWSGLAREATSLVPIVEPGEVGKKADRGPVFRIKGLDHQAFTTPTGLREKAQMLEGFSPIPLQQMPLGIGLGKPDPVTPPEPIGSGLAGAGVREAGGTSRC